MSSTVGILEWVEDTTPFQSMILQGNALKANGNTRHLDKLNKARHKAHEAYAKETHAKKRDAVIANLKKCRDMIDVDLMKRYLMHLGVSPEAQITVRTNFARSLAALSIASYIIGIGDRHMENLLLDTRSGAVVPIDFGHAFGSATQLLPQPELMPFRLSAQMCECFSPLGPEKLLCDIMVHVMAVLRRSRSRLLTSLDVFVKEPLVEWTRRKATQIGTQDQISTGSSVEQYAKQRIAIAQNVFWVCSASEVSAPRVALIMLR